MLAYIVYFVYTFKVRILRLYAVYINEPEAPGKKGGAGKCQKYVLSAERVRFPVTTYPTQTATPEENGMQTFSPFA